MNILITNDQPCNPKYGGIERVSDILAKALISEGHKVYYFALRTPSAAILEYAYPAEVQILPNAIVDTPKNKEVYLQFLEEKEIELIINQRGLLPEANFFIQDIPSRIQVVSVLHSKPFGYWDVYWDTYFANRYGLIDWCKCVVKVLLIPYLLCYGKQKEYRQVRQQLEWVAKHSSRVVVLSEEYKEILSNRCAMDKQQIVVIPNPNTYDVVDSCKKEKEVIYVGRLAAWDKNAMALISIWSKVEAQHPDWKLTIVGDGPLRAAMQRAIRRKGLRHVEMVGTQDPKKYYERAQISMLVSHYEGFPMAVTESMQYGVVPIVMNSFCANEIIADGQDGRIIAKNDIDGFAEVLSQLMSDDTQRAQMAAEAQQSVQRYKQSNILDKWFQLLSQFTM